MPINPKEAPEGFHAAPGTGGLIPLCIGCWFYEDNSEGVECPRSEDKLDSKCISSDREDKTNVIFLKIDSD